MKKYLIVFAIKFQTIGVDHVLHPSLAINSVIILNCCSSSLLFCLICLLFCLTYLLYISCNVIYSVMFFMHFYMPGSVLGLEKYSILFCSMLVGLASSGGNCTKADEPSVFEDVSQYTGWIKRQMEDAGYPYPY